MNSAVAVNGGKGPSFTDPAVQWLPQGMGYIGGSCSGDPAGGAGIEGAPVHGISFAPAAEGLGRMAAICALACSGVSSGLARTIGGVQKSIISSMVISPVNAPLLIAVFAVVFAGGAALLRADEGRIVDGHAAGLQKVCWDS